MVRLLFIQSRCNRSNQDRDIFAPVSQQLQRHGHTQRGGQIVAAVQALITNAKRMALNEDDAR